MRQWAVGTGEEVEPPYDRHTGAVSAAVYSPDRKWVASAGSDRTVRVWRAEGRQDVAVLHGHTGHVTGVAFAPDSRRLASLSRESMLTYAGDDTVRVWDVNPAATLPALRGHTNAVADHLKREIQDRLSKAGVEVIEARISHLAYAPEIAAAMLQRQQAGAIIAARQRIVEGAVGMVEMALGMLSQKSIVALDEERKAQMVSNLLVVLCGERGAQPVINTGTLYQ